MSGPSVLDDQQSMALRERLYGAVSALSLLLVYSNDPDAEAWPTAANLIITALALWGAAFVAELLAHTAAHAQLPSWSAIGVSLRTTWQIVQASATPATLLCLAGFGWIATSTAITLGVWILVVTLGVFAFAAVWRTPLRWSAKLVAIAVVLLIGIGVVALKTLVH